MFAMKPELRQILCGFHCKHVGNARKLCVFMSALWNDLIFHFSQGSYVNAIAQLLVFSLIFLCWPLGSVFALVLQGIFSSLGN